MKDPEFVNLAKVTNPEHNSGLYHQAHVADFSEYLSRQPAGISFSRDTPVEIVIPQNTPVQVAIETQNNTPLVVPAQNMTQTFVNDSKAV
jgi:hypothetical protein